MNEKAARSTNAPEVAIVRDWLSALEEHEGDGIAEIWWDSDAEQWTVDWIKA